MYSNIQLLLQGEVLDHEHDEQEDYPPTLDELMERDENDPD